jgi:F-type H+-transporting ATPase subunit gamma
MPAAQQRQIRRRIHSVRSTKKVTRAMELIAASRIVKAQQRVAAARPYAEAITRVVGRVVSEGAADHPLLRPPGEVRRIGLVVLTGDRGLAGPYNSNVLRTVEREAGSALIVVGRRAHSYFRYRGYEIHRAHQGMSESPTYDDARRVANDVMALYETGAVDAVDIIFTQFLSSATQRVVRRRLLPVEGLADRETPRAGYELEPGEPAVILDRLLPRYVEARLFAALLDASASEHAARQRAMKAATENADDLVKTLTRAANQARQRDITTEIVEIVGGAEAMRQVADSEPGRRQ